MKRIIPLGYTLFVLLLANHANSQQQERWVEVHGTSVTSFDFATGSFAGSQLPPNYFRQALNLEVRIAGLPLGFSAFYSTGNQKNLQGMNALTVRFDYNRLLNTLLQDSTSRFGKIQRSLRWLVTLEAGDCHPNYSPLTLTGIGIQGINIAINPGPVYAAMVYGVANRSLSGSGPYVIPYKRSLWLAKTGFGKVERSHFYLSLMHARDRVDTSLNRSFSFPRPADTLIQGPDTLILLPDTARLTITPAENWVAGAELALTFWKQKIRFEAEATASFFTPDYEAPAPESDNDVVKVFSFLNPRLGSHADWACRSSVAVNLENIRIKGSYTRSGPGYQTMGSPYLLKNSQTIEGRIIGTLLKKILSYNVSCKYILRDPEGHDVGRFRWFLCGGNLTIRIKKWPVFTIQALPTWQTSVNTASPMTSRSLVTGLSSSYPWRVWQANCLSGVNFTYITSELKRGENHERCSSFQMGLNQSIGITRYFNSRFFVSWTREEKPADRNGFLTTGLDIQTSPTSWFSAVAGGNYMVGNPAREVFAINCSLGFLLFPWLSLDGNISYQSSSGDWQYGQLPAWSGRLSAIVRF